MASPALQSPAVAARIASTLLVVGLLAGTAAAFAVTERLKLVPSPIAAPRIDRIVGPLCDCPREEASIVFRLRDPDRVTLQVVDGGGEPVRTLIDDARTSAGDVEASWDGRDDDGEVVAEGSYRPRVHLDEQRRTITLPNPIRVDTTPPEIEVVEVRPRRLSPGVGDRNNRLDVVYEVSEQANAVLFVDGQRRVRTRFAPLEGRLEWFGVVDGARLPAGTYRLEVAAEDRAGNTSPRVPAGEVEIWYIALARTEITVPAGARFGVRVATDAPEFSWLFAGGRGSAEPGLLVLRAPRSPGRYRLFVEAAGRAARAEVTVVER
jgi:hypothetical protein